jgi:prolyl-tRNA synthetase
VQAYVLSVKAGEGVSEAATKTHEALRAAGIRSRLNDRTDVPFGRRAVDAELKGYPVRVEIGPRDLADGKAMLVRRIDGSKTPVALDALPGAVAQALEADQQALYDEALRFRQQHTTDVSTLDEAIEASATGFARLPWSACGTEGEAKAAQQAVTVRCLQRADGTVPDSDNEDGLVAILGRSY